MKNKKLHYSLTADSWDNKELLAINKVVKSNRFTMGKNVKKFENNFSKYIGSNYSVMVNSGSSANLLMVAALFYSKKFNLKRGDEIIVPSVSWSTTYFPLAQYGLKIVFVDIDLNTLNLNHELIEKAITKKTKAIFAVNLLGNSCNYDEIKKISRKHSLYLIEDNCESLGSKYKNKYTGTFGIMGSYSFFFSHHLQTIEGGMIVTNDLNLYEILVSLRAHGWTRDLPEINTVQSKKLDKFYDSFNFVLPGYNLRPGELNGAIGIEQLKKIKFFMKMRRLNANFFRKLFANDKNILIQSETGTSSWFGFSMILINKLADKRDDVIKFLELNNIETRPIVAGNFTKNPVIQYLDYRISGKLTNADISDKQGFFIGNDHRNLHDELSLLRSVLDKF